MPQPTSAPHRDELLWGLTGLLLGLALYLATDQVLAGAVVGVGLGAALFAVERVRRADMTGRAADTTPRGPVPG